jgi:predicted dehydrogenase
MHTINWGIIGCGNVTEIKSGPAFNKVPNSALVAVMRRNATKAADYAKRHNIPRWYNDANALINDPEVNAIYIATPPDSHEAYALAGIDAGKPVYIEKPMTLHYLSALNIATAANAKQVKVVVAHYRREQPIFKKIKSLLQEKAIGKVRMANIEFCKPSLTAAELATTEVAWRVNPSISGGGLFHDLAPHQLDLMYYFFGAVEKMNGIAVNQSDNYTADDLVVGNILFKSGVVFTGSWCFNAAKAIDNCTITGSNGSIHFNIFGGTTITVVVNDITHAFSFDPLQHVQQPMIEKTVQYFLDQAPNPCSANDGAAVMQMIDAICINVHNPSQNPL